MYVFNQAIHNNPGEGVLVSLLQASIPYSFYNVRSDSNDSIKITVVKDGATANYTITVPAGNYTVTSLAQKLKEDIETQMDDGETNVTITYDRITNKFKFAISPATRSVTIHGEEKTSNLIILNELSISINPFSHTIRGYGQCKM
eukprot:SAG22_NODE_188_length_15821_cov_38.313319_25_plen_145_part_00